MPKVTVQAMAQQWYIKLMGMEIGPLTPADVTERVRQGQIQPETPVRLGQDGKWQTADRVKGLLGPRLSRDTLPTETPVPSNRKSGTGTSGETPNHPESADVRETIPISSAQGHSGHSKDLHHSDHERAYHVHGEVHDETNAEEDEEPESGEYDFFQFVGFELAIGHELFDVLRKHCHEKKMGMTEVTRHALAAYLGRKDLLPRPPGSPATGPPKPDAH